jgi:16S rRNA processing protein RimM
MTGPLVALGRIGRAHGIRGDVRVVPYNASSTLLVERRELIVGGERRRVRAARAAGDAILVAFEGVTTREAAELLRGAEVALPREELPAVGEGELYLADLVGCECWEEGASLGTVTSIAVYPASACLVIESASLEIPTVAPYLVSVDLTTRRIEIAHSADFRPEPRRAKKPVP